MYNTKKFKRLHCREITSLPQIKKVIYCSCHLNNHQKSTACLSPHPFAYNQNLEHLTISQFCWLRFVFFFNHWVYSLLVPNFQKSPKYHLSKAFVKMYDFNQALILSSRFHNLCKECVAQWLPLFSPEYNKNSVPDYDSCCLHKQD